MHVDENIYSLWGFYLGGDHVTVIGHPRARMGHLLGHSDRASIILVLVLVGPPVASYTSCGRTYRSLPPSPLKKTRRRTSVTSKSKVGGEEETSKSRKTSQHSNVG